MADFMSVCSRFDRMPALWPRGPMWPYDEEVKGKILSLVPVPEIFLFGAEHQRHMDMTHRHFVHLLSLHEGDNTNRPGEQWVDLLCTPAGYDGSALISHPPCTAKKFGELYMKHLALLPDHKPCASSFPLKCDSCRKVCTSECGVCGEIYCSRACMKKEWKNHKQICETVWENGGNLASRLTQMEMTEALTDAEMSRAFTSSTGSANSTAQGPVNEVQLDTSCHRKGCESPSATKKCGSCTQVRYCSKACQKKDWREHKPDCLKLRKLA